MNMKTVQIKKTNKIQDSIGKDVSNKFVAVDYGSLSTRNIKSQKRLKGFTLIELIVVVFVMLLGFWGFNFFYKRQMAQADFQKVVSNLAGVLSEAQANAAAYYKDAGWTVALQKNGYAFYRDQYNNPASKDFRKTNLMGLEIVDPNAFSDGNGDPSTSLGAGKTNKIFFEKGTGKTKNTGEIFLRLNGGGQEAKIKIDGNGKATVEYE